MASSKGYNRREFLKVLGAGAGIAAAGCSKELPEKIIPYVIQPDEVIPGVANWYTAVCQECSGGCGILVRVREGRAVKLEGNPNHPINKGGLCAIGQSSLQAHYNPDRVREPLARVDGKGPFVPLTWEKALTQVSDGLQQVPEDKDIVLLTGAVSGSLKELISEFSQKYPRLKHVQYELFDRSNFDAATEKVFGVGKRALLDFSKADVILSVGADFLETWMSPVEYARQWAERRKPDHKNGLSLFVHIEPRLSLTASNADRWVTNAPGSENAILLALLKLVVEKTGGRNLSGSASDSVRGLVNGKDVTALLRGTDVSVKELEDLATALTSSSSSLVVAGGAACQGKDNSSALALAQLLNAALGNVGKSVNLYDIGSAQPLETSFSAMRSLVEQLNKEQSSVGALIVAGVNPSYLLPNSSEFRRGISNVPFVCAAATVVDETTASAQVVLPLSTNLESWSDSNLRPGVWSLNQPAMQPLYQSQGLGDTLLAIAGRLGVRLGAESVSFHDYIRWNWKERMGADAESDWTKIVQKGGDWSDSVIQGSPGSVDVGVSRLNVNTNTHKDAGIRLLAYPSINSIDGKSANRPWMQELPNPMTSAIWDSWAEVHPELAAQIGVTAGDLLTVKTEGGAIEVPVYLNRFIHKQLVAVPIGQGHEAYGRYADGVGANVLKVLSYSGVAAQLLADNVKISRSTSTGAFVTTQGSDTQKGRAIMQSIGLSQFVKLPSGANGHGKHVGDAHVEGADSHNSGGHGHGYGHGGNDLGPRPAPKQMYHQMEHPEYRWGMSVDLAACTGCAACVVACYAENNIPVVGKELARQGREMSWLRIERYVDGDENQPVSGFVPMMCQQCGNAPCEPVCPVYATYHNEQGLNAMVYNRCVGTRYCANNCSYKVRRFNWFHYTYPEPLNWQLNPDVTVREVGVMEKCSFCVQRIKEATNLAKDFGRGVEDGEIQPACASSCPTNAITFGNLLDEKAAVTEHSNSSRSYKVLDAHLNTQPGVTYLARVKNDTGVHKV